MTRSDLRPHGKATYFPPKLTVYGGLTKLTATGTIPGNENGGMPMEKG